MMEMEKIVVDTNVFVSALLKGSTAPRQVLRLCLKKEITPLMGNALLNEYEEVLGRESLFKSSPLKPRERDELFNAFLSVCKWLPVYYLWRPNLPDEADNHLLELAIAGNAEWLVTGNTKDFALGELKFGNCSILTPARFMKERKTTWQQ